MKRGKIEWVFSTESCVKSTPVIVYEKASQIGKPLNNGKPLKNGKSLQIGESAGVVGCEEYHVFVGCYDQCVYKLDVEVSLFLVLLNVFHSFLLCVYINLWWCLWLCCWMFVCTNVFICFWFFFVFKIFILITLMLVSITCI